MNYINKLQEILDLSENVVFFGGAGVSTESGIPDFRSDTGIYSHTPEEVLSRTYFENHTEEFFDYYRKHLIFNDAKPNPAHYKLAEGEKAGKIKAVVDNLVLINKGTTDYDSFADLVIHEPIGEVFSEIKF